MELSCYFYTPLQSRDQIYIYLIDSFRSIIDDKSDFSMEITEDEDDGDSLFIRNKYLWARTSLYFVEKTMLNHHININFAIDIVFQEKSKKLCLEFIGKLAKETVGDLIVFSEDDYVVLEKRNGQLLANKYFFEGNFDDLSIGYSVGILKIFTLKIQVSSISKQYKMHFISMAQHFFGEGIYISEDEDRFTFEMSTDYFTGFMQKLESHKDKLAIGLYLFILYPLNDRTRMDIFSKFLQKILISIEDDYVLEITKGYYNDDYQSYTIMKRINGVTVVNKDAEEKELLEKMELPFQLQSFDDQ